MRNRPSTMSVITKFKVTVLLLCVRHVLLEDTCSEDGTDSCNTQTESKYSEEANDDSRYLQEIEVALSSYTPCATENCSCHLPVIIQDLELFKNGIDVYRIEETRERGTKYQIIDHRLFRDPQCMFPARCSGVEHFLKPMLKTLPDMELIVNTRDWPQIYRHFGYVRPVFSFSKTKDYMDIMCPAWSFWEGGPAIGLYPRGLGRWDQHRQQLQMASKRWPWTKKKPLAFFRGSRTSAERDQLILLSRERPDLADAAYTRNQAWKSDADTLGQPPAEEVSLVDHCQFRYLFNFRGVAASFRFKHLFLCGSLVFHVGDEWQEFFYESLKPWVHYIPVPADASKDEIRRLLSFVQRHDEVAHDIAERGRQHIWDHLSMKDIQCYWHRLLKRYAQLLMYIPQLDETLVEIK